MQIGIIGLGRMGGNIVRRLTRNGHRCVVFDQNATAVKALVGEHVAGSTDLKQLVGQLEKPRVVNRKKTLQGTRRCRDASGRERPGDKRRRAVADHLSNGLLGERLSALRREQQVGGVCQIAPRVHQRAVQVKDK